MSLILERPPTHRPTPTSTRTPEADRGAGRRWIPAPLAGLEEHTVAGIALGIVGLFLFNIVCGPIAIALGAAGYRRSTRAADRTAAVVSIVLGIADLVLLAVLVAATFHDGSWVWRLNP